MIAVLPARNATSLASPVLISAALVAAAFWFTLWSAVSSGIDSPLGIAPAAVPLAAWAGYLALRRQQAPVPVRDLALDGPVASVFIGAAVWLVWGAPGRLGWRYWSERHDLLAFELFALGTACLILGAATLWRARASILVLALGSPPVLTWLEEHVAPPLAGFSAWGAHLGAGLLQLHFQADTAFNVFQSVSDSGVPYFISIVDACSGLSSWISVVLTGIPAAIYLGLGPAGATVWLVSGLVLMSLANTLRIVTLLFLAQHVDPDLALGTVHPVLGTVLLFLVLLLMLLGIEGEPLPPRLGWQVNPGRALLMGIAMCGLAIGIGQFRLMPYSDLPPGGPLDVSVAQPLDILPELPNLRRDIQHEIAWQNLFGADSKSYLVHYQEPSGTNVVTQLVTTPDVAKLMAYTPERCDVFHGDAVRGQKTVDLGLGQVGFLVDSRNMVPADASHPEGAKRQLDTNILYWYVPFSVDGDDWNARFVLILDSDDVDNMPPLPTADRGLAPGGPEFDRVDSHLVDLGRQITTTLAAAH